MARDDMTLNLLMVGLVGVAAWLWLKDKTPGDGGNGNLYYCPYCGEPFYSQDALDDHIPSCPDNPGGQPGIPNFAWMHNQYQNLPLGSTGIHIQPGSKITVKTTYKYQLPGTEIRWAQLGIGIAPRHALPGQHHEITQWWTSPLVLRPHIDYYQTYAMMEFYWPYGLDSTTYDVLTYIADAESEYWLISNWDDDIFVQ